MSEKNKNEAVKNLDDKDLEKAAGAGRFSSYTDEEYNAAGIDVIGPGKYWNDGYKLRSTGEELDRGWANWGVSFYREFGRAAKNKDEIIRYRDKYVID